MQPKYPFILISTYVPYFFLLHIRLIVFDVLLLISYVPNSHQLAIYCQETELRTPPTDNRYFTNVLRKKLVSSRCLFLSDAGPSSWKPVGRKYRDGRNQKFLFQRLILIVQVNIRFKKCSKNSHRTKERALKYVGDCFSCMLLQKQF